MSERQSGPCPTLAIFRVAMGQGGADRVTLALIDALSGSFQITLVLMRRAGVWLDDVPRSCRIEALDARSLWVATDPLAEYLRRERPTVLLSLDSGGNIPAILAHGAAGRPGRLVISERNILFNGGHGPKRLLQVVLKRLLYHRADRVLAVSRGVKDDLVRLLGLAASKVVVVHNPVVDASLAQMAAMPVEHPWFREATPVILTAGRLVAQKDHRTLLRAFAIVRETRPTRLFVLGDGPLRPALEAEARRLGVADAVCFAPFDKNPFRYMARCTVFALTSRNEGLPGVLIQAMACGAPVVATDCHAGPREIVDAPGENGLLVPVGDARAVAAALASLLGQPEFRATVAAAGQASSTRYEAGAVAERYREALVRTA